MKRLFECAKRGAYPTWHAWNAIAHSAIVYFVRRRCAAFQNEVVYTLCEAGAYWGPLFDVMPSNALNVGW